ncbi:ABC transporter permease subunit [uncultured Cohaesibacter sp.]|uniref:carbohydrate ABC transporter permease n=1 Tax=uncultured Cohaesibacter sp. TaxID=1002546 RepID=UPI00292D373B|nr:ABC transporter permease subunit [uncultured Cohaesibacter sp.]
MIEKTKGVDRAANIVLATGMIFILFPLVITLVTATQSYEDFVRNGFSFMPGTHFLDNISIVIETTHLPRQILNSIIMATMMATIKCVIAFLTAYAIVYFRIRYGGIIFAMVLVTNLMPLELRFITTYQVASNVMLPVNAFLEFTGIARIIELISGHHPHYKLSILNTYFGLAAPLLANGTGTFLFRQYFRSLPADLSKAAKMDGAGPIRFLWDILMPLSKSNFAALFLIMFLGGWTQYLWPLVAASTPEMQTAVVGLARLSPGIPGEVPQYPAIMAGAVMVSVIPLLMIAFMQRHIVRGLTLTEK